MAIEGTSARVTIAEQLSRNPANRDRPLALEVRDPASGRLLRASEVVAAGAKGIGGVIASAAFRVMKNPVTVAMFRQFVEDEKSKPDGYRIDGHNANELMNLLADPKKSDQALTYVSHEDATKFIN